MRILHLIQKPQLRGAEVFTSQLANHLNQSGHEAIIVSIFHGSVNLSFDGEMHCLNGNFKHRFYDVKAWLKLARIIKNKKPDIIQANAGDTLKYAVFSKLIFRWKQPLIFRNASVISLYIKSKKAVIWNRFFFRYISQIISVSKTSAEDFATLFPQFKKKIVSIPIGIEILGKEGFKENGSFRIHFSPALIHVGGFTHEKNHIGLISIFEKILKLVPGCTLHLIGDGILKKDIEAIVKAKNLESKIFFRGQQPALQLINDADVLLLPSLIEGLPGVILESFYCKKPVVANNVGGVKEIVINNETGRLINKGDEKAFANGVVEALKKNEYNQQLLNNAYNLVTSKYLNTQITDEFISVYQSILS